MTKVLSVASEAVPLIKTGGLADVVGALPAALAPFDVDMRVILPAYPAVKERIKGGKVLWQSKDLFGGEAKLIGFQSGRTEFLALDAPHLYDRKGGPYLDENGHDHADNAERFAALAMAAAQVTEDGLIDGWQPDLVHMHDWQSALTATYLQSRGKRQVPSIMTIHNIAFQGYVSADHLDALELPHDRFNPDGFEFYGQINMLKAGLTDADFITTVSPTYANELKTPDFGVGLDGLIRARQGVLSGILNGVDLNEWNPENSEFPYSPSKLSEKAKNKDALLTYFKLPKPKGPLAIVVTRLTHQKGIDLLIDALPDYFASGGALALLGSGDPYYENELRALAHGFSDQFGLHIGYDEKLSHAMFAGGDAVLVPSRFEPCGLTQLYGLRYGTLPVVAPTGGLADTVIHANEAAISQKAATGITMTRIDSAALKDSLLTLTSLYRDKKLWKTMQKNAMSQAVGWDNSAKQYKELYQRALAL